MGGATYTVDILVGDGRKTIKHVKIQKPQQWDDEPSDVRERAVAAADRLLVEYPDYVVDRHEWPSDWSQVWYLDPA